MVKKDSKELANELRKRNLIGKQVMLIRMDDIQAPMPGATAEVRFIDDIGTIHVAWSGGGSLGLVYGEDIWCMADCNIPQMAYARFQLSWMQSHGITLNDIFKLAENWRSDSDWSNDTFQKYFEESGFGGEIYPCFSEFLDSEFQDKDLMRDLLSDQVGQYDAIMNKDPYQLLQHDPST